MSHEEPAETDDRDPGAGSAVAGEADDGVLSKMESAADNREKARQHHRRAEELGEEIEAEIEATLAESMDVDCRVNASFDEDQGEVITYIYPDELLADVEAGLDDDLEVGLQTGFSVVVSDDVDAGVGEREGVEDIGNLIADLEGHYDEGVPVDVVIKQAEIMGMDLATAKRELAALKDDGDVYEPRPDHLRTT